MIRRVLIENFRCFQSLKVENLKGFNLITGKNNVGKTAFIEALFLHLGTHNPEITHKLDGFRGVLDHELKAESIWAPLFNNFNITKPIRIITFDNLERRAISDISLVGRGTIKSDSPKVGPEGMASTAASKSYDRLRHSYTDVHKKTHLAYAVIENEGIKYERPSNSDFEKGMFISSWTPRSSEDEAKRFSKLLIENKEQPIIDALKILEPRIQKIIVVNIGKNPVLFANIGLKQAIAINYLGEGITRLLQILLAMSEVGGGIVFIDEIDRGFHYESYQQTLKSILDFSKKIKIQIFATTHSKEFINSTYKTFVDLSNDDLEVIRFSRKNGDVVPVYYDFKLLGTVIENEWEIR